MMIEDAEKYEWVDVYTDVCVVGADGEGWCGGVCVVVRHGFGFGVGFGFGFGLREKQASKQANEKCKSKLKTCV